MNAYTDEGFRSAIDALGAATRRVAAVRDAIDPQEPIHRQLDTQLESLGRCIAELERILGRARNELL